PPWEEHLHPGHAHQYLPRRFDLVQHGAVALHLDAWPGDFSARGDIRILCGPAEADLRHLCWVGFGDGVRLVLGRSNHFLHRCDWYLREPRVYRSKATPLHYRAPNSREWAGESAKDTPLAMGDVLLEKDSPLTNDEKR